MSDNKFSHFMVGGTNSGSGKTTLTLGILRALKRRGLAVAPFKCGPDYIDPMFHAQAAGRDSINLDSFFHSDASYGRYLAGMDAAVAEGVMGLFDGSVPGSLPGSCAEIAARLRLPVILTVNARGLSGSIAPLVSGFSAWHPEVRIAGVIANQVGSERHAELLRSALASADLPPLIGFLPREERWILPERHLGLAVGILPPEWFDSLADTLEKTLDFELLLKRTRAERPVLDAYSCPPVRLRLGVARDEAFCFYYPENFDLLRQSGVEAVPFSPLRDPELPAGLDGIYFGGGYPELYAESLSANVPMRNAVRAFAETRPVYGECGGYLYLLEGITDFDGRFHPGPGLLPGRAKMNRRLAALGYREVSGPWGRVRGHEFHYSELEREPGGTPLWTGRDLRGGSFSCGGICGRVKGSYIHLHFASSPEALHSFIQELES